MIYERPLQEDLHAGADLLYDLIKTASLNGKVIPNQNELIQEAIFNFDIGVWDSLECVKLMYQKHEKGLWETNYFKNHSDIYDTKF